MTTAAVQERGGQVLPPVQLQVERFQSQPLIHRMKENVIWAWSATYEKLEAAGSQLKILFQKIWEAIRTFFEPKFESAKKAAVDLYHRFASKKEPVPISAPAATLPAAIVPPQERVEQPAARAVVEEQKPQGEAPVPEQQFFVPAPIDPAAHLPEGQPLQVQMPVPVPGAEPPPDAAVPLVATTNAAPPPAVTPAVTPPKAAKSGGVGAFGFFWRLFV